VFIFLPTPAPKEHHAAQHVNERSAVFPSIPLWRAASRNDAKFTFVGLEGLPLQVLQNTLRADAGPLAAVPHGDQRYAEVLRETIVAHVQKSAINAGVLEGPPFDKARPIEEHVEVFTVAEYRARVGEEAWAWETFADRPEWVPVPIVRDEEEGSRKPIDGGKLL
jgi:hypothetical protein